MILISSIFIVLGFALVINAFFVPFVKEAFNISITWSYLVMTATLLSFVVFGVPSRAIIRKFGYNGGMIIAFLIMAIGFNLLTPSANFFSFPLLLLALFISGMGQILLTGAVSTYVSVLCPSEGAANCIVIIGIYCKTSYAIASLMLVLLMDVANVLIEDTILPFCIIYGVLIGMGFLYYFAPIPEAKAIGEEDDDNSAVSSYTALITSIFQFLHQKFDYCKTGRPKKYLFGRFGAHDNPFGQRLTAFMINNGIVDTSVPMSLLANHPNV